MIGAGVGGPATKSAAEKFVLHSGRGQAGFERFAIELRKAETAGTAADVAEDLYVMRDENSQELLKLETGVSNCKDRRV